MLNAIQQNRALDLFCLGDVFFFLKRIFLHKKMHHHEKPHQFFGIFFSESSKGVKLVPLNNHQKQTVWGAEI